MAHDIQPRGQRLAATIDRALTIPTGEAALRTARGGSAEGQPASRESFSARRRPASDHQSGRLRTSVRRAINGLIARRMIGSATSTGVGEITKDDINAAENVRRQGVETLARAGDQPRHTAGDHRGQQAQYNPPPGGLALYA